MTLKQWSVSGLILAAIHFILVVGVFLSEVDCYGEFCGLGMLFFALPWVYLTGFLFSGPFYYFGYPAPVIVRFLLFVVPAFVNTVILYYIGRVIGKFFSRFRNYAS